MTLLHLHDNNSVADLHLDPICDKRGGVMEDATYFRGRFFRYFLENRGRVR